MSTQPTLVQWNTRTDNGATVKRLASRPCGTNTREVAAAINLPYDLARSWLVARVRDGLLVAARDPANTGSGSGWPVVQFFASENHAAAWLAQPMSQRPNVYIRQSRWANREPTDGRRRRSKSAASPHIQRATWRKAPMVGSPIAAPAPVRVVSMGVASGIDNRYQLDPKQYSGGELSRLGPGRYAAEAQGCAAKAVR